MTSDGIRSGSVIRYPYLWAREAAAGETEGRKKRPVAVAVRIARAQGGDALFLFAITSQAPDATRLAVEIPQTERRRAGLDRNLRLWIVLDECNQDVVGESFYLEPEPAVGRFSRAFFLPVLKTIGVHWQNSLRVNRSS